MAETTSGFDHRPTSLSNAEFFTPEFLEHRSRVMEAKERAAGFLGIDQLNSQDAVGHAYGIRISTRLTSNFRRQYREGAMDVTTQDVVDVFTSAGIKNWVLMGLHGYVGYMPEPRATQDVDVLIPYSLRERAVKAVRTHWPQLVIEELPQVTRFCDPSDLDAKGNPRPVLDLMTPWSPFQELILKEFVVVDEKTKHRLPTVEAALASKFAAMISPFRSRDRKEQDAVDFRRMTKANRDNIRIKDLRRLAELVYEGGGDEIERFLEIAVSDQPFPV